MGRTHTGPAPTWTLHVNVAQDLVSSPEWLGATDPAPLVLLHVGAVGTLSARNRSGSPSWRATTWCCELGCRRDRRRGSGVVRPTFLRGPASFTSSPPRPLSLLLPLSLSPFSLVSFISDDATLCPSASSSDSQPVGSKLGRAAWRCVTSPAAPANDASAELSPRQRPLLLFPSLHSAPLRLSLCGRMMSCFSRALLQAAGTMSKLLGASVASPIRPGGGHQSTRRSIAPCSRRSQGKKTSPSLEATVQRVARLGVTVAMREP